MDNYVEHLVKRNDPSYFQILKVLFLLLDVIGVMSCFISLFGIFILAAAAAGTYFVFLNASVEYEYLYIAGSLSIDRILNKQKRKKVLETNESELVLAAPIDSDEAKSEIRNAKIMDYSGKGDRSLKYYYVLNRSGEKQALILEVTDELLKEMRLHSPSRVRPRNH